MTLETIEHAIDNVRIDEADRSLQEILYQRALAKQNARIVLVRMQKFAEEIRAGRHPRISPDEQRFYEIAIKQLRQLEVPEYRRIEYLKAVFKFRQDYSEIRRYLKP